jgi:hypothetical protein
MTDVSIERSRRGRPKAAPRSTVTIRLENDQFHKLECQAADRNMTPAKLMYRIASTIIEDDLINAVLDDKQ